MRDGPPSQAEQVSRGFGNLSSATTGCSPGASDHRRSENAKGENQRQRGAGCSEKTGVASLSGCHCLGSSGCRSSRRGGCLWRCRRGLGSGRGNDHAHEHESCHNGEPDHRDFANHLRTFMPPAVTLRGWAGQESQGLLHLGVVFMTTFLYSQNLH